jgi:hypothetical protein
MRARAAVGGLKNTFDAKIAKIAKIAKRSNLDCRAKRIEYLIALRARVLFV